MFSLPPITQALILVNGLAFLIEVALGNAVVVALRPPASFPRTLCDVSPKLRYIDYL